MKYLLLFLTITACTTNKPQTGECLTYDQFRQGITQGCNDMCEGHYSGLIELKEDGVECVCRKEE